MHASMQASMDANKYGMSIGRSHMRTRAGKSMHAFACAVAYTCIGIVEYALVQAACLHVCMFACARVCAYVCMRMRLSMSMCKRFAYCILHTAYCVRRTAVCVTMTAQRRNGSLDA